MVRGAGTTLGGVQRQTFAPNLKAQRKKKESDGGHALHKLLQTADSTAVKVEVAHQSQQWDRPREYRPPPRREGHRAGGSSGGGGSSSGAGKNEGSSGYGAEAKGGAWAEDGADEDHMEVDQGFVPPAHESKEWLGDLDAPLALPLRPHRTASRGCVFVFVDVLVEVLGWGGCGSWTDVSPPPTGSALGSHTSQPPQTRLGC